MTERVISPCQPEPCLGEPHSGPTQDQSGPTMCRRRPGVPVLLQGCCNKLSHHNMQEHGHREHRQVDRRPSDVNRPQNPPDWHQHRLGDSQENCTDGSHHTSVRRKPAQHCPYEQDEHVDVQDSNEECRHTRRVSLTSLQARSRVTCRAGLARYLGDETLPSPPHSPASSRVFGSVLRRARARPRA